jgi:NADH dehydrogenase FAD-containing subunit
VYGSVITTNAHLAVQGAPDIYALGDCATVSQSVR